MNSTLSHDSTNIEIAKTYYQHMLKQNFDAMKQYLDHNVTLVSPLATITGKEKVVSAAQNLTKILKTIEFKATLSKNNQVMMTYDFIFSNHIGTLSSAVLMEFKNNLITNIHLFYDARPFVEKK